MKLPFLFWVITQGSSLLVGQPADEVKESKIDLQTVIRENAKNSKIKKTIHVEYESEYFGIKENEKKIVKIFRDQGKERFELKTDGGHEYKRVVANGFTSRFRSPVKNKPIDFNDPLGGEIFNRFMGSSAGDNNGSSDEAFFLNGPLPWNWGVSLQKAVVAKDTIVQFSMMKPQDGRPVPVIFLINKNFNDSNINGKGEYNADGYNETDNTSNRYNLEIWFSPEHNFSISKLVYRSVETKQVFAADIVEKFTEVQKNVFLPESCSYFTYSTKQKKLILCNKIKLIKAEIPESFPDEVFLLKFPEGVPVFDYQQGKIWFANKDGKFDHFLKNAHGFPKTIDTFGDPKLDVMVLFAKDPLSFLYPAKKH